MPSPRQVDERASARQPPPFFCFQAARQVYPRRPCCYPRRHLGGVNANTIDYDSILVQAFLRR